MYIIAKNFETIDIHVHKVILKLIFLFIVIGVMGLFCEFSIAEATTTTYTIGDGVYADYDNDTGALEIYGTGTIDYSCKYNLNDSGEYDYSNGICSGKFKEMMNSIEDNLKSVSVQNEGISLPEECGYLFFKCDKLTVAKLSKFDTKNVTDMNDMFYNCSSLTTLDVSNWNTSNVTNMRNTFNGCKNLTTLDVSSWNTGNVINMSYMFYGCKGLTYIDVSNFDTSNVTNLQSFFDSSGITKADVSNFNTSKVTTIQWMFSNCSNLEEINLGNIDTSNVTNMRSVFNNCYSLKSVDVSNFNTSKVTTMYAMFYNCNKITTLDLSNFDTSNVTTMYRMFGECINLTTLDISGFNTSQVEIMKSMFYNCNKIKELDLSNFDTSNVTDMSYMFNRCSSLTTLNMSSFNANNVTNNDYILYNCSNLTTIYTPKVYSTNTVSLPSSYYNVSNPEDTTQYTSFNDKTFDESVELRKAFTLTINPNGGIWNSSTENQDLDIAYGKTKTISNPSKTGYTFAGWTLSGTSSTVSGTTFLMGNENATLTANWTANTYTVKYDGNGATEGTTADSIHTYDVAKTLTANGFERKYTVTYNHNYTGSEDATKTATYGFVGWAKTSDGLKVYSDSQSVSNLSAINNGTVNFYAVWNSASVTYVPTRTGYTFGGWYTDSSCTSSASETDGVYTPTSNTTLYAKWIVDSYKVTYDYSANGGTTSTKTETTVNYNSTIDLTPTATKSGWTFVGWNTDKTAQTALSSLNMETNNVTLYAIYKKDITATVKYYNNQTSTETKTIYNTATNTSFTLPTIASQTVSSVTYIARGYSEATTANGTVAVASGASVTLSDSKIYYATYSAEITGTFYYYSGSAQTSTTAKATRYMNYAGTFVNSNYTVPTATTLSGYTQRGWSTSTAATGTIIATPTTASTSYYMSYTYTVTLTYNANGGSLDSITTQTGTAYMNSTGYKTGASITITSAIPEKTGYTFGNAWNTKSDKTGTSYTKATAYSFTSNATLYAEWSANTDTAYTVKHWEQNVGAGTEQNSTNYTLVDTENKKGTSDSKVTPAVQTYTGFTSPTTQEITISADGTTVVNYYYTRNSYSVTLNKGTGITAVTGTGTYQYGVSVTIDAQVSDGYTWSGWTGTHITTAKQYTFTMPASNVTLAANATINSYTLTVNPNGGTWEGSTISQNFTLNYLETKTISNPSKTGYTFAGWTLSGTSSTVSGTTFLMGNENATLTANWEIDPDQKKDLSYKVEFYINDEKQEKDTETITKSVQVLEPDIISVDKSLIDDEKYLGYQLDTSKEVPETIENNGTVKIYYKNKKFSYKIEYYYNGYKDETLTETGEAEYLSVIDEYEDKVKEGYMFEKVFNFSLTISYSEDKNIVKVCYKTDQAQRKELSYVIQYYKDGKIADTMIVKRNIQVLLPNEVAVDKSLVETDRYLREYNFVKTEPEEIPEYIKDRGIISVYYESKISQVVAKYVDKVTGETILEDVVIEGKIDDEYNIEQKEIDGYTLVEAPEEITGTITDEEQEKVFYYAKNATVTVKYLEKDDTQEDITDNEILAEEETIVGYEGKEYETTSKEIENYELVETPENVNGTMSAGDQEVIYYYAQKTKVTVNYIDILSGDVIDTDVIEGLVGDSYLTKPKDFEGYVLVKEDEDGNNMLPENAEGTMTKDEIVVNYYYKHVSAGVIEKHIDKISGEILDNILYEGNEGDPYETSSKEFEGYDLLEKDEEGNSLLPENATGTMTKDLIEVKYYYVKKSTVKVEYLDRNTLEEIALSETIEGHEGDEYTTTAKEIEGYVLVGIPSNAEGTMTKEEIVVTYYYKHVSAGVVEKHIDKISGEVLDSTTYEGNEGDSYETSSKEFEGYNLDENNLPENAKGIMTEDLIEVKYYYKKVSGGVVERHIDIETEDLLIEKIYSGNEGDLYKTSSREFEGYKLVEKDEDGNSKLPTNAEGTMTKEQIVVTYYYEKEKEAVEDESNKEEIKNDNNIPDNTPSNNDTSDNEKNDVEDNSTPSNTTEPTISNNNEKVTTIKTYTDTTSTNTNTNTNTNTTNSANINTTQTPKALPKAGDIMSVVTVGSIIVVIIINIIRSMISIIKRKEK